MCRLSILVPWWNEARSFEDTLVSILEHRPQNAEILVVHPHRYGDPYELRNEVRFIQCAAKSELELINTGFYRAAGDVVHVVRCGLLATRDWTDHAAAQFERPEVAAVAVTIVGIDGVRRSGWQFTRGGKLHRLTSTATDRIASRCTAPCIDASFFRRQSVLDLGGFNPEIACFPELDLGIALSHLQLQCMTDQDGELRVSVEPACLTDSSQISEALEVLYWQTRRDRSALRIGLSHLMTVAGELVLGQFAAVIGRLRGWRKVDHDVYWDRIADAQERMRDRGDPQDQAVESDPSLLDSDLADQSRRAA
ncbi:MAG TPA: glycosyltransferase family 2 protein [Planctomycetes bacterium]|nr:glycosyltransferase family 2 protein [Planctomycetota bacterium]